MMNININDRFSCVLTAADKYQVLLERADKCKVLTQEQRNASLAQKKELTDAVRILVCFYGLSEASKEELQKCLEKLNAELKVARDNYETSFDELTSAINDTFGDRRAEDVWPVEYIDQTGKPEPLTYQVDLVGFGNDKMFTRRAFYRLKLERAQEPMTPNELEDAYIALTMMLNGILPVAWQE